MRPCERTDSLLSAHIEGETSPAEARFLDAHLASCSRCLKQKTDLESLLSRLHTLPRADVSPEFTQRVLARTAGLDAAGVDSRPVVVPIASRWSWSVPMAAAAALLVAVWGVHTLRSGATPEPETARITAPSPGDRAPAPAKPDAGAEVATNTPPVEVQRLDGADDTGEWLDGDAYVLESFELREPAGGGSPTLTRASGEAKDKVVVTF